MDTIRIISIILLSIVAQSSSFGQSAISTSCATATDGNCTVDWTMGEVITSTGTMGSMAATQGFHQPGPNAPSISISDPCTCGDPRNVHNSAGFVDLFHDVITISSPLPVLDAYTIVSVTSGGLFTQTGANIIGTPAASSKTENGTQVIDIWRSPGSKATVFIENTLTGQQFEFSTLDECLQCPEPIPTAGNWALIILFLILASAAVIQLYQLNNNRTSPYLSKS